MPWPVMTSPSSRQLPAPHATKLYNRYTSTAYPSISLIPQGCAKPPTKSKASALHAPGPKLRKQTSSFTYRIPAIRVTYWTAPSHNAYPYKLLYLKYSTRLICWTPHSQIQIVTIATHKTTHQDLRPPR